MAFEITGGGASDGGGGGNPNRFRRKDAPVLAFAPGERPHDLQVEMAVLAGIMLFPEVLNDLQHKVKADDYYLPAHKDIYECMVTLAFKNRPIDLTTVMSGLKENGKLEGIGGPAYLAKIADTPSTTAHALEYAQIVADLSWRRRLLDAGNMAQSAALSPGDTRDIASRVEKLIFDATQERKTQQLAKVGELLGDMLNDFERRADNQGIPDPHLVMTGLSDLDAKLTGFRPGQLLVLAAGPGTGKTALSLNIMHDAAVRQKKNVLLFSLEMTRKELVERMMSFAAKIDAGKLRAGNLTPDNFNDLYFAADELTNAGLFIDDRSMVSPYDILASARKLVAGERISNPDFRLDLIICDYIQIMKSGGNTENRSVEVAAITGGLKAIAKEMNVPVLALSQLNRDRSKRTGTDAGSAKPQLSDLRDSGAIEQDADVVMFIHREMGPDQDSRAPAEAEIIVAKHRAGPTGSIKVTWLGHLTRYTNYISSNYVSNNYGQVEPPDAPY
jgi:replicative DNA helicase